MKPNTHPDYKFITVQLADGTEYQTRSTMSADNYSSEVDATNHPFYTGKRQYVDTAGRVEKFMRRYGNRGRTMPGMEAEENAEADETK